MEIFIKFSEIENIETLVNMVNASEHRYYSEKLWLFA